MCLDVCVSNGRSQQEIKCSEKEPDLLYSESVPSDSRHFLYPDIRHDREAQSSYPLILLTITVVSARFARNMLSLTKQKKNNDQNQNLRRDCLKIQDFFQPMNQLKTKLKLFPSLENKI